MEKLKCPHCGNDKSFYKEIYLSAKVRVNNKGNNLKSIYDIDKTNYNEFDGIKCYECDNEVDED